MNNLKLVGENFRISLNSIKSHRVRTVLTILIIAFGIMALVGILTAISAIEHSLKSNFSMMGANTFNIKNRGIRVHFGDRNRNLKAYSVITYSQAEEFKKRYDFPATVAISVIGTGTATVKYLSEKTNPNVQVIGVDDNYLMSAGLKLAMGRNITSREALDGSHVAIIGQEIKKKLFPKIPNPVGKIINIGPGRYRIIGVLKEKGTSSAFSGDRSCLLPINNVRQYFSRPNMNYSISVTVNKASQMNAAVGQAIGIFRIIREDRLGQPDSFKIDKSEDIANMLIGLTKNLQVGASAIGFITLLGAAIGLMNIMLVSVTERTREIGIRKALGAKKTTIRNQFLFEAVLIAQMGGALGIIFGIVIGNVVSLITHSSFVIPWIWVGGGILLTFIVALISGILPANKAARLDPIESLRYE